MLFRYLAVVCVMVAIAGASRVRSAPATNCQNAVVGGPPPTPSPTNTPRPDQTSWVEGHVFDARTHKIIAGAEVSFEREDDLFETRTDATGHYRINHVAPGEYAYSAGVTGYSSRSNYAGRGPEIPVPAKGLKFDIALLRQGKVSGQVRDIRGRPVAGAKVRVYALDGDVDGVEEARTNAQGHFQVSGLDVLYPRKEESYEVVVSGNKLSRDTRKVRVRPFYQENDEAQVALTMRPRAVISGQVTFRGRPYSEGAVIINGNSGEEDESGGVAVDKNGRYSVSLSAPATYSVMIYSDETTAQSVEVRVLPGRNSVVNRALKPFPFGSLRGRIVNLKGQPVQGADIELWTPDTSETEPVATTDKEGRFFVAQVAPRNDYEVSVNMPRGAFRGGIELPNVKVRSYRTTRVFLRGDTVPPRLEIIGAPRVLDGQTTIRFRASDNQGLKYASPQLDGSWMADEHRELSIEFNEEKPPRQATGSFTWNSRNATNGRHRLSVEVNDLAGNTAKREWFIWVKDSPTPRPTPTPPPFVSDGNGAENSAAGNAAASY